MPNGLNRRDALKALISAGGMAMVQPASAALPDPPLVFRSQPVELTLAPVSAQTMRITIHALRDGKPVDLDSDGALLDRAWPPPIAQIRSLSHPLTFRAGNLTLSVSPHPTRVLIRKSEKEIVQELVLDESGGGLQFNTAGGLLLGLGQGGPQFDRRGHSDSMVSGQAGYQLGTHGARADPVPDWNRRLGYVHSCAAGGFRPDRRKGATAAVRKRERSPHRRVCHRRRSPRRDTGRIREDHRPRGDASAMVARISAVASHAGRARRHPGGGENLSREEAPLRRHDLSRHRVLPQWLEYR